MWITRGILSKLSRDGAGMAGKGRSEEWKKVLDKPERDVIRYISPREKRRAPCKLNNVRETRSTKTDIKLSMKHLALWDDVNFL